MARLVGLGSHVATPPDSLEQEAAAAASDQSNWRPVGISE